MKKYNRLLPIVLSVSLFTFFSLGCISDGTTEPVKESVSESFQDKSNINTTKTPVDIDKDKAVIPEILSSNSYINSGYFYIVGEIQNNLSQNIGYVKIVATYYDDKEEVLGTSFTFTDLDILKPNQKAPFELSNYPDNFIPHSYKIQASYQKTSSEPYNGLSIKSHRSNADGNYFKVVGEVENTGDRTVNFVRLVATFYNENDEVIGTSFTYTDIDTISPGSTSPFELSTYPQIINPARYEIQVQAN